MKNNFFIEYAGKIKFVTNTETKQNKAGEDYQIRSLGVDLNDTNEKYPVTLVFEVLGNARNSKKIDMLNGLSVGEEIVVTFTINSRPYVNGQGENKYFIKLNLIGINKGEMNQDNGNISLNQDNDISDLPF